MPHTLSSLLVVVMFAGYATGAVAQTESTTAALVTNPGLDAMAIMATLLAFLVPWGFALREAGMTRAKNTAQVLLKNFLIISSVSLAFWLVGYGLLAGKTAGGWLGTQGFAPPSLPAANALQLLALLGTTTVFAVIVAGAWAERTRLIGAVLAALAMSVVIFPVMAHWAWNPGGWLSGLGFVDFAGGSVVHVVAGWCALAGCWMIGPRLGRFDPETREVRELPSHNLPLVVIGASWIWLGWFGLTNAADVDRLDGFAGLALNTLNTQLAACAGVIGALATTRLLGRKASIGSAVSGAMAGLVSVSAGCLTLLPMWALVIGFVAGLLQPWAASQVQKRNLDDAADVFSIHAVAGAWGTLALGMFGSSDLFNLDRMLVQALGVAVAIAWSFPMALAILAVVKRTVGLRAKMLDEQRGLDFAEQQEIAYPEFQKVTFKASQ